MCKKFSLLKKFDYNLLINYGRGESSRSSAWFCPFDLIKKAVSNFQKFVARKKTAIKRVYFVKKTSADFRGNNSSQ